MYHITAGNCKYHFGVFRHIILQEVAAMENIIYVVVPGDTLWKLAETFGTDVNTIARYNGIADPDYIEVGQVLRIPAENISDNADIYIVRSGDTLFDIAMLHNTTIDELATINGLDNANHIEPGQVLRLPTENDNSSTVKVYTVRSGDTLWKIAQKFGTTVIDLINMNRITNPDLIYPGQVLTVRK